MEPRPQIGDALRGLVSELVAVIDERLGLLTSRVQPDLVGRQCAAGGLARARALLEGIILVGDGNRADVAGVLLRTLYETYIASLYLLLGGAAAALEVMGDYAKSARTLAEKHGRPLSPGIALWHALREAAGPEGPPVGRLKYENIAGRVGELLQRAGDPRGGKGRAMERYDIVYRVESQLSAHAGLGSMGQYVDWKGDPTALRARPAERPDEVEDRVVLAALMTAHLASRVFGTFGLRTEVIELLYERIDTLPDWS
jgi:hypothetical protein